MPIVQGENTIGAIRWVDPAMVEHQIVQVWLGEELVFDGTVPALVSATAARATGAAADPLISAGLSLLAVSASAVGEVLTSTIEGWAAVEVEMSTANGDILETEISAGVSIEAVSAEGAGEAYSSIVGESAPGEVVVEAATGTVEVYSPAVESPAEAIVAAATAVGEVFDVSVSVPAAVDATTATGLGVVYTDAGRPAPLTTSSALSTSASLAPRGAAVFVSAGANVAATAATAAGAAEAVSVPIYATVPAVVATGTGSVPGPVVLLTPNPQRMNKSGTQSISASTMTKVTGWTADAGYPSTAITSDGLVVTGSGTMVIHAQVVFAGAGTTANTKGCQIKVNSTVVATFTGTTSTATWGGTQSIALANGDVITMEATHSSATASNRVVQASGTYLYFDIT